MHFQKEMLVYDFHRNCDIPVLELLDKFIYWEIVSLCIDFSVIVIILRILNVCR